MKYHRLKCIAHSSRGREVQDQGTSMITFWGRHSSWLRASIFSLCFHLVEGARGLSYQTTKPLIRTHPHGLIISPRPHLQTSPHWVLGAQHVDVWRTQTSRVCSRRPKQTMGMKRLVKYLLFLGSSPETQMGLISWLLLSLGLLWCFPLMALGCLFSF